MVQPVRSVLGGLGEPGCGLLPGGTGQGIGERKAGNLQQRPGLPVHQPALHGEALVQGHQDQNGRPWASVGQRVRGGAVAHREAGGGLLKGLRDGGPRPSPTSRTTSSSTTGNGCTSPWATGHRRQCTEDWRCSPDWDEPWTGTSTVRTSTTVVQGCRSLETRSPGLGY